MFCYPKGFFETLLRIRNSLVKLGKLCSSIYLLVKLNFPIGLKLFTFNLIPFTTRRLHSQARVVSWIVKCMQRNELSQFGGVY